MTPYIICLLPVLFASILSQKSVNQLNIGQRGSGKYSWLFLLPMAFLLAFKSAAVGADTVNYNRMFTNVRLGYMGAIEDRIEWGYVAFLKVITRISSNPQTQYIVVAILFAAVFGWFMKKNAVYPGRFAVLFMGLNLFAFYLTGIRQVLAMLICLCTYESIKKRKIVRFALWVALAFLFHKSALFFIPAYFVANWKPTKNKIWLYLIMFAGLAVTNEYLFNTASDWLDLSYGIEDTGNGYIMAGLMAIVTVISFVRMKQLLELDPNNKYLLPLNALHMGFWILRLFSRTAERPSMFYAPFTILLIEQLILTVKNPRDRFIINALVMLFFGAYFIYKISGAGLAPYTFCW